MDIWTFDQLLSALAVNDRSGKLLPGHIFTVDIEVPTRMIIEQDDLGNNPPHSQDLKKNGKLKNRVDFLGQIFEVLKVLADPRIPDVKQIEL